VAALRPSGRRHLGRWRPVLASTLALVVFLGASACTDDGESSSDTTEGVFQQGGELRLAGVDVNTFDPANVVPTNQAEMITIDLLYDSLTVFPDGIDPADQSAEDRSGGGRGAAIAEPNLAESLMPNGDATVWTVKLADREFSDGTPVRAADVKASYERLAKKGSASLAGVRLEIVTGYQEVATGAAPEMSGLRVIDDRTLEIGLREPYIQISELLASPLYGIVPKASADQGDAAFVTPVSSGPYRVTSVEGGTSRLERTPVEAGEDVGPDAVVIEEFANWDDAYRAFVDGRVDWTLVPPEALDESTEAYGSDYFTFFGGELWFGFNLNDPTYSDARFRQAIVQAVDGDAVVRDSLPGRWPLRAIVLRDVPGFDPVACQDLCEYDPDAARALLAQAFPAGTPVPTVVLDSYEDPVQRAMLNSVQSQLQAVGIPSQIRMRTFEEYRTFATSGQQAVFSFGWVGVAPLQDVYLASLFWSGSPDNVTGFRSPDVDALVRQARINGNAQERESLYRQIERQVLSQSAIVPIAQLRTNQVVADRVHGWSSRLDGTFVVDAVWVTD
jgi:oligopeptide transport system substrate-binding protein